MRTVYKVIRFDEDDMKAMAEAAARFQIGKAIGSRGCKVNVLDVVIENSIDDQGFVYRTWCEVECEIEVNSTIPLEDE